MSNTFGNLPKDQKRRWRNVNEELDVNESFKLKTHYIVYFNSLDFNQYHVCEYFKTENDKLLFTDITVTKEFHSSASSNCW